MSPATPGPVCRFARRPATFFSWALLAIGLAALAVNLRAADPVAENTAASPNPAPAATGVNKYAQRLADREKQITTAATAASQDKDKLNAISDALSLADEAADFDDYAMSHRLISVATTAAKGLKDPELPNDLAKAKKRITSIEVAYAKAKIALETLKKTPNDAAANQTAGTFFAFYKNDWDRALPMLLKCEDQTIVKAAKADRANPKEPSAQVAAGDGWWNIAQSSGPLAKAHQMLRARHWYKLALTSANDGLRERLKPRIDTIDRVAAAQGVAMELALETIADDSTFGGKLTPQQQGRVAQIMSDFRKPGLSANQQDALVNKALNIGGPAVSQLLAVVNKQLQPQLRQYGEDFQQQAKAMAASRTGGDNSAEIQKLRAQVLALKERANLTKEMIVAEGDPAMEKLEQMLVVGREDVFKRAPRLMNERQKLMGLGRAWERCSGYMVAQMVVQKAVKAEDAASPNFEKYLSGEEELAAKMAMPMDESAKTALTENAKLIGSIDPEEARAILACNLTRQLLGLSVLKIDHKLCDAARDHSKDMRKLNFFAHESPVEGKKTPWDRAKNFGTTASGENIAMGYSDGNAANKGWFHSPGHHKNMLGGHKRIGLGVAGSHYTELFGG